MNPAILSKKKAHSTLHTIFCESPFSERTYDCLLALATARAIMKLQVIQPISWSNRPQGKMGGIHYLLLHETNNPCMYTEVLLLLHLISVQTVCRLMVLLGCLLHETACIVQIFIRSEVFTEGSSLSLSLSLSRFRKRIKFKGHVWILTWLE